MAEVPQAPNQLDLVIDFVNTLDLEQGTDVLATADGLASWLSERGHSLKPLTPSNSSPSVPLSFSFRVRPKSISIYPYRL